MGQALGLAIIFSALPVVGPVEPAAPRLGHETLSFVVDRPVEVPRGSKLVGVTWPATAEEPEDLEVRTSRTGKGWTTWQPLWAADEEGPDPGTDQELRRGTFPLWLGDASFVQFRSPVDVPGARLHFIDPGSDPGMTARSASASPPKPRIISRAGWGADESIRRCCPRYASRTKVVFIHHTATGNNYTANESAAIVRSIYAYHVQTLGWDDIGYNLLVDRYGQIFEGRAGGAHRSVIGAHARGFNSGSTGIAMLGTFESAGPPHEAADALKWITAWRMDQDFIDPLAGTTMKSAGSSRYEKGTTVSLSTISGHRDVGHTDCPGGALYGALNWLRHVVAQHGLPKMYDLVFARRAFTPNADGVADGVPIHARFSSSVRWRVSVFDRAGRRVWTQSGSGTSLDVTWWGQDQQGHRLPHGHYQVRIGGSNAEGTIRKAARTVYLWDLPNGTLLVARPSLRAFVLEAGKLRHITSHPALVSRYRYSEAVSASDSDTKLWPTGADIGFRDGSIVRVGDRIRLISDQRRRAISRRTLRQLGYDERAIIDVTTTAPLRVHPSGPEVTTAERHPDGTALRASDGRQAWRIAGRAHPLLSNRVRQSHRIRVVDLVGPEDAQVTAGAASAAVGFREGSLLRSTGGDIWVIEDGLRRRFTSRARFEAMGYKSSNVRSVNEAELSLHQEGPPI